jgi:2,5-diketo-D-gluconate reductase B
MSFIAEKFSTKSLLSGLSLLNDWFMENAKIKASDLICGIMPVIGFGTWEITGPHCIDAVSGALNIGYRHIDTAQIYGNEKEVGKGIKASGVKREEIFLTTKVATGNLTSARIKQTAAESLERLGTGYVDLLLIHWPTSAMDLRECLDAMFGLVDKKLVRYAGVSNFSPELFLKSFESGPVITNQVKFTPYKTEYDNLKVAIENDKIITAYSPLARGSVIHDKLLGSIGEKYGKSASQVALRWLIQLGNVSVIPKAASEKHQLENFDIFDFQLTEEDMHSVRQLNKRSV